MLKNKPFGANEYTLIEDLHKGKKQGGIKANNFSLAKFQYPSELNSKRESKLSFKGNGEVGETIFPERNR